MAEFSSLNPWSAQESLLGMRLGDPQSGLTLARRHGLLSSLFTHENQVGSACTAGKGATKIVYRVLGWG